MEIGLQKLEQKNEQTNLFLIKRKNLLKNVKIIKNSKNSGKMMHGKKVTKKNTKKQKNLRNPG